MEENKSPGLRATWHGQGLTGPRNVHTGIPSECPVCRLVLPAGQSPVRCDVCRALLRQQAHWNAVGDYSKAVDCLVALQRHHEGPLHKDTDR